MSDAKTEVQPCEEALEMQRAITRRIYDERAALRSSLTTALAERDVLQRQVSDAVKEYDELEAANNALTVERDEARRQLGEQATALFDARRLFEAISRDPDNDQYCDGCETAKRNADGWLERHPLPSPTPPPEADRG